MKNFDGLRIRVDALVCADYFTARSIDIRPSFGSNTGQ
jgi:hypothetical protein